MPELESVTGDEAFSAESQSVVETFVQSVAFYGDDGARVAPPDDFEPGRLRFETFFRGQKVMNFAAVDVVITSDDDVEQVCGAIRAAWNDSAVTQALRDAWECTEGE